jgi:type IV fimbrial biogenesis protein FimT
MYTKGLNKMDFRMPKHHSPYTFDKNVKGLTLIELMVSVAVTSILAIIAIPNYNNFMVRMRVDNEISQLHRMLLITRNSAINSGQNSILCPLNSQYQCTEEWQKQLSVFTDINGNKTFDSTEEVIRVREAITEGDRLLYGKGRSKITFNPMGQLSGLANGTFRYCPRNSPKHARGIIVARSGRVYQSNDIDNDGIDENRGNQEINCE